MASLRFLLSKSKSVRLAGSARTVTGSPTTFTRSNSSGPAVKDYGKCPSCGAPLKTRLPACTACSYLQLVPKSVSYHEIFGIPHEPNPFIVDPADLKQRYRAVQQIVHPDLWAGKEPEVRRRAQTVSGQVNTAYHTLLYPIRRANYILGMNGYKNDEEDTLEDPELVMEVMEIREALEAAEDREQVEKIRADTRQKFLETQKELEALVGEKKWPEVKSAAVRLRYLLGVEEAAKAWPNTADVRLEG